MAWASPRLEDFCLQLHGDSVPDQEHGVFMDAVLFLPGTLRQTNAFLALGAARCSCASVASLMDSCPQLALSLPKISWYCLPETRMG